MTTPKTVIPDEVRGEILSIYDEFLVEWPEPTKEVTVPTRYGITHVTETGPKDGPVIVLLHGMGFPGPIMWATLVPHLSATHRLIAPDTIGDVGKSLLNGVTKAPRSGADYARWLDDVLEGVGVTDEKVSLVGTSYGAWIALHYCLHAPDRIDRLALMSPLGIAPWSAMLKLMRRMTRLIREVRKDPDAGVRWLFADREDLRDVISPWMRSLVHRSRSRDPSFGPSPPRLSSQWVTTIRYSDRRTRYCAEPVNYLIRQLRYSKAPAMP
jgi:pimeloyl-ACP methyl ester carboxylesterase